MPQKSSTPPENTFPRRNRRTHPSRHALRRHHLHRRFRNRTRPRPSAALQPSSIPNPVQRSDAENGFEPGMKRADGRAVTDYAFHCIITDLPDANSKRGRRWSAEASPVSGCSRPTRGTDAPRCQDLQSCSATAKERRNGLHARRNGGAIDVIVQQALAEGKKAPEYHALTRPTTAEAEAVSRAIALSEMAGAPLYIVHLSCNDLARRLTRPAITAFPRTPRPSRNTFIFRSRISTSRASRARNTSSRHHCAKVEPGETLARSNKDHLQVVLTDHCPFCFTDKKS